MRKDKHTFLPGYALTEVGEFIYRELQHELCFHVYFKI